MSCVLEILSLHELNTRKANLLKQINKIDIEIQKRNIDDLPKSEDTTERNIPIIEKSSSNDNLLELEDNTSCKNIEEPPKSLRIKINITKNNPSEIPLQDSIEIMENTIQKPVKKVKIKITKKSKEIT